MRPASSTHWAVALLGLVAFLAALGGVVVARPFGDDTVWSALLITGCCGGSMWVVELVMRVRRYPSVFTWRARPGAWRFAALQCVGLACCMGLVAGAYWLWPEYRGGYYRGYFDSLVVLLPAWLGLAFPYFWLCARWLPESSCGLYVLGVLVVRGQLVPGGWPVLRSQLLSWSVRGFFLALMWTGFQADLQHYFRMRAAWYWNTMWLYQEALHALYTIDVGFACAGYLISSRLVGCHSRSVDSTVRGWVIAVVCYQPVWSVFGRLYFSYQLPNFDWVTWLMHSPVLAALWGSAIVALIGVYAWATVVFGLRFSNLSNRGVITSGPYRWHRHPAYICKNLSWWLASVPWLASGGFGDALRHCLLLLGVNAIYAARAWTEEQHMRQDPAYREYAAWVDRHGLVARLRAWLRPVRYGVAA